MLIWESNVCEVKSQLLSRVWLFATPWTVARQAPLCMEFFRREYLGWAAMPFSRGSSRPRGLTWATCIAGRFIIIWATIYPYKSTINCLSGTPGIWSPLVISILCLQTKCCVRNQGTWCLPRASVNESWIGMESSRVCSPSSVCPSSFSSSGLLSQNRVPLMVLS